MMTVMMACPICLTPFNTWGKVRMTCSMTCRRVHQSRLMKGRLCSATAAKSAAEARGRRCRERTEADAKARFGPLSAREIALFNFAAKIGYRRGYHVQRRSPHRKAVAA